MRKLLLSNLFPKLKYLHIWVLHTYSIWNVRELKTSTSGWECQYGDNTSHKAAYFTVKHCSDSFACKMDWLHHRLFSLPLHFPIGIFHSFLLIPTFWKCSSLNIVFSEVRYFHAFFFAISSEAKFCLYVLCTWALS